jgi:predicted nucleic acid-binding protein
MTQILLDTSAYVHLTNGHRGITIAAQFADAVGLTPVVIGELMAGFLKGSRAQRNLRQLEEFQSVSRVVVHDVTEETARRYAFINNTLRASGTPIPTNDIWIAATAMQHGLTLLTLDRHFLKVPQILVECFDHE